MVDKSGGEHPLPTEKEKGHGSKCFWHYPNTAQVICQEAAGGGQGHGLNSEQWLFYTKS